MGDETTDTGQAPWRGQGARAPDQVLHLVIVWAASPERVGEVAALSKLVVLGRGPALPDDPGPRLRFVRQRPGSTEPTPMLESKRLSRLQLSFEPRGDTAVEFQRIGRCPLLHNGTAAERGVAREGDLLTLVDVVTFLVERRPKVMPEAWGAPAYLETPFGCPDRFGMIGESAFAWELRGHMATLARGTDPI